MTNLDSILESRDITNKCPYCQSYGFFSSHVWILDHEEGWTLKNWYFQTECWRRLLRFPWTVRISNQAILKEINPEHSLEGWSWSSSTWPPDAKNWPIRKCPDAGKAWGQKEKGMTEDEMVRYHHWPNGHEFEQTPRDSDGQGSLVFCSPWGCKGLDMTKRMNNNNSRRKYL